MNEWIKKNSNKYIAIFILLQPMIDLITGIGIHLFHMNITIGMIIRLLFLLLTMYITVFVYKKKKVLFFYITLFIYLVLYILGVYIFKDGIGIFRELQGIFKVFYFPTILLSFYMIKEDIKISKMTLFTSLFLYLICILIPIILNMGYQSYQITKVGTAGFYNSANEISGIISILTPIIFIIFKQKKYLILKLLFAVLYFVVILTIGTKTPLLSLLITMILTFIWIIVKSIREKKYKILIYSLIIIGIGVSSLIIIVPKTNFYRNIKTHLDYLEVDHINDIMKDEKLIDHFIFSQRLTFLRNKQKLYNKASIYEKLIGIGYLNKGRKTKLVEMDYFDIYYSHGLIGFIFFFGTYLYILIKVLKEKQKLTYDRYMLLTSLLLILFLSFFTGHIIISPAVSIFVISIIFIINHDKEKNLS